MSADPNNNHDIMPVDELDFGAQPAPEQSNVRYEYERPSRGCGCAPIWIAAILGGVTILLATMAFIFLFATDTRNQLIGNVEDGFNICLLDCGDDVLTIEEGPILQALKNTNWQEGVQANRNYPQMKASKDWPVSWLTGSRSLKYNALVRVTAGVDFELIENWESAVELDGDVLTITIPPPQIRDCILLEEQSSFYDYSCKAVGVVAACGDLEESLRLQALRSSANDDYETVLNDAFENVGDFLQDLVLSVNSDIRRVYVVMDTNLEVTTFSAAGTCIDYAASTESVWDQLRKDAQ